MSLILSKLHQTALPLICETEDYNGVHVHMPIAGLTPVCDLIIIIMPI